MSDFYQLNGYWMEEAALASLSICPRVRALICYPDSLTQYLYDVSCHKIEFRLLSADWGQLDNMELQMAEISTTKQAWVRRIEWCCNNQVWISARTAIPQCTVEATGDILTNLGSTPLGEVVFNDPGIRRSPFFFSRITQDKTDSVQQSDLDYDASLPQWARRSILYFQEYPIAITELFFPAAYA